MGIEFDSAGVASAGTDSLSLELPADIAAGDLLVACVASDAFPTRPDGWHALQHSQTFNGPVCTVWVRRALGAESGTLEVTIPGGTDACGKVLRYTGTGFSLRCAFGLDTGTDWLWRAPCSSDPGIRPGDVVLAVSAVGAVGATFTLKELFSPGVTVWDAASDRESFDASGLGLVITEHQADTGESLDPPSFRMVSSVDVSGCTVLLRIRESLPSVSPRIASGIVTSRTPKACLNE